MRKPAAVLFVLSLAVLALALVPAAGLAAKGGGGNSTAGGGKPGGGGGGKPGGGGGTTGGGTIDIVLLNSTDGVAHYGQKVTFTVSTSATSYPYVTLRCSVPGVGLVYQASKGIFPTSLGQVFTLGPTPMWQGGEADCTATLEDWDSYSKNGSITPLKSMSFHVYA